MSAWGLTALPYYGGKARLSRRIADLLGPPLLTYAEPFFGMGAVLLKRKPANTEVVCDVNDRVVNWWRVLRTDTDALIDAMACTPSSRSVYRDAADRLDEGTPLERAARFAAVVFQGRAHCDGDVNAWTYAVEFRAWTSEGFAARMRAVARRVRDVAIESRPAADLLKRLAKKERATIYCDPPYLGARTGPYHFGDVDVGELADVLVSMAGRVAVSGYGDTWDHLGWRRTEIKHKTWVNLVGGEARVRTEVLWTNFRPETSQTELDLEEMG